MLMHHVLFSMWGKLMAILRHLVTLLFCFSVVNANAQNCESADPTFSLVALHGDYEFAIDPDDPSGNLVYVNHVLDGKSPIVVARFDGASGLVLPGTVTTIANNFDGLRMINGPEFVHPPGRGLGVLYRALDGVHGVFRPASPRVWNDFSLDIDGAKAGPNPPRLRSSYRSSYEAGDLPFHQDTYTLRFGPCSDRCFAKMSSGIPTDVARVVARRGLAVPQNWLIQGVRDASVLFKACTTGRKVGAVPGTCGIYEVEINGAGGLVDGSLKSLASLPPAVGSLSVDHPMAVARHPATGTTVLFFAAAHETGKTIDIYEQSATGGAFALTGSAPVGPSDHYRILDDGRSLVLHYLVVDGNARGSYSLAVGAARGRLIVGQGRSISPEIAAEVVYLPAAGKFAIYFRAQQQPHALQRCFFEP